MRLVTFEIPGIPGKLSRIGALTPDGRIVDLTVAYRLMLVRSGMTKSAADRISGALVPPDMLLFIEGGGGSLEAARKAFDWALEATVPDGEMCMFSQGAVAIRSPIPRPPLLRDFMAFEEHLQNIYPKLGRSIPPEWYNLPVYYKGNPGSTGGDGDDIRIPSYEQELDYEFEMAFVIGVGGADIRPEDAFKHIYGYMIYNDFSARSIQEREMTVGLGPAKGKDFQRGHVLGPYLVTADEISDVYNLTMTARVNGKEICRTNTRTIHWKFEDMIAHASRDEELVPGEVFGTGTVGNGSGKELGKLLKAGDVIELTVEGLGTLRNKVISNR
ncbi:fumarylacetoacetate hydrolase family protein [Paenibacillus thalictri]|uniref:Fumarylacetoacetate hydrolase family protein n=1 Tax=Paenibacillus thalictri TaxID=2527873 RepID=A0A4Q9DU48_9BACL|nr:fumarylacetoacetate hydrolase family protein [Paenibacillus thalictri]TBL79073.1 fumarylacetoacetate hydrolase family protein [Paenibacillus thalictri]